MAYYINALGYIFDENMVQVNQGDGNPDWELYVQYLEGGGELFKTDYLPPDDFISSALELETERYLKRTRDGISAYAKISAEFRLAKLSGQISEQAHGYIENLLIPVRNEVLAGQWISGLQKLEAIGVMQVGQELYNRLHSQLSDYITENY